MSQKLAFGWYVHWCKSIQRLDLKSLIYLLQTMIFQPAILAESGKEMKFVYILITNTHAQQIHASVLSCKCCGYIHIHVT